MNATAPDIFLAVDLGAESGRVMAVSHDERHGLGIEEVHRFPNKPISIDGTLHWNIHTLYEEILSGLATAARSYPDRIRSIGIDTWGVDYGLLDEREELIDLPVHYRDARNDGMADRIFDRMPAEEIYRETGIQTLPFNTLFQIEAEQAKTAKRLARARRLLFIPDLLAFWLTGVALCEHTIASTSQMLRPGETFWHASLLGRLGLPTRMLQPVVAPGSPVGPLTKKACAQTGLPPVPVVSTAGHDTAAAVAGTPGRGEHWAFLSSGTWSLLGVETIRPVISDASFRHNFTNEAGVYGTTRLLKNIAGLYLVQECRKAWQDADGKAIDYADLIAEADKAPALTASFDVDDPRLASPGGMPPRIEAILRENGQPVPTTRGHLVRVILESLALRYRDVLDVLETVADRTIHEVIVVGGGSRNHLLNQMLADASGRQVTAGPAEATALGNALVQMITHGTFPDLAAARAAVLEAFPDQTFQPRDAAGWKGL